VESLKKRKGGAILIVLLTLIFVMSFVPIMYSYYMNNLQYTLTQRERIEAYYLVFSGLELGKNAVLQENTEGGKVFTIVSKYADNPSLNPLKDNLTDMLLGPSHHAQYEVLISVYAIDGNGNKHGASEYDDADGKWVEIYVSATVPTRSGSSSRTVSHAGSLRILGNDPAITTRHLASPI